MSEHLGTYSVIVAGAGGVFEKKMANALDLLGPSNRRIIMDRDYYRALAINSGNPLVADVFCPPFYTSDHLAIIATPNHLEAIQSLVASGIRQYIVEKPLVDNSQEIGVLKKMIVDYPDLKIYPLDFYLQKELPLLALAGKIHPHDPRWKWMEDKDGNLIDPRFSGELDNMIGPMQQISITLVEGGEYGVPDLNKRPWLEHDSKRGGMLLDLGTHAFVPLFAAGLFSRDMMSVSNASRSIFNADRNSFVQTKQSTCPELMASADLVVQKNGQIIPIKFQVAKTYENYSDPMEWKKHYYIEDDSEGYEKDGVWNVTIWGTKGKISMGLRSGGHMRVTVYNGNTTIFKVKSGIDPYSLAFQEADLFFHDDPHIAGNFEAMADSIALIDMIKKKSNE